MILAFGATEPRERLADRDVLRDAAAHTDALSVALHHYAESEGPVDVVERCELIRLARDVADRVRVVLA